MSSFQPISQRDFIPKPMPSLRLQGRWLDTAGFAVGAHVRVRAEPQRLILEVIEDEPRTLP